MRKILSIIGIFSILALMLISAPLAVFSGNASTGTVPYTTPGTVPYTESNASSDALPGTAPAPGDSLDDYGVLNISGRAMSPVSNNLESGNTYDKTSKAIIMYIGSPAAYVNGTETFIDKDNMEVTPVIIDNIAMVPVRFISEELGGIVEWTQRSRTIDIILNGKSFRFTEGSDIMTAGGKTYTLGVAVQLMHGRNFVPLNKLMEILNKNIFYDRGLIVISDEKDIFDAKTDKELISEWITKLSYLPAVGSHENLIELLEKANAKSKLIYGGLAGGIDEAEVRISVQNDIAAADGEMSASVGKALESKVSQSTAESNSGQDDYSTTNVQVQGVDEGDIVKTDGEYIYQVNKQRIVTVKANPPDKMNIISTIDCASKNISPKEIYLHGNKLVIIGSSRLYYPLYEIKGGSNNLTSAPNNSSTKESEIDADVNGSLSKVKEGSVKVEFYPAPQYSRNSVKALIYDMTDKENITLLREIELEGNYISSRKIGSALYLVANSHINNYYIQGGEINSTPFYRDTIKKDEYVNIGYDAIRYFPGLIEANYMVVAGIDIDGDESANVSAYLGAGRDIYVSGENLYVAVSSYSRGFTKVYEEKTQLYKFALKDAKLTYLCKGEVPGTILNQFSMDENGSRFRIATTKGNVWGTGENISRNCLYVLDDMLSVTGSIDDMAPGERIYSVRFMGDRAYVVTFKTVDPLFVIDLKDPLKPAILGALKIPGYSDYLHPYDENHIIGFGKDTVEIKGQAYYMGMKVALFDVSDVSNPVQKFAEMIGDRGTESELLRNHKALLFSKEKNLLAFPITLMEVQENQNNKNQYSLQYGQFTFQGALVYNLDLTDGFKLKGRITHLTDEDYLKAGNYWYDSDKNVQRVIYIGDTLYTLSNSMIMANDMESIKYKGSVSIP